MFSVSLEDAGAFIGNLDNDFLSSGKGSDSDGRILLGMPDGIIQQIDKNLHGQPGIHTRKEKRRGKFRFQPAPPCTRTFVQK